MAYTLSDLLQDVYEDLGELNVSTVTSGSTTTVVDSKQAAEADDDDWKEGVLFITRDSAGAGAAPEGQFQRISSYTGSSATFTIDTALTVTPAVGDTFSWASNFYPFRNMIELANAGLRKLGDIAVVDTTTLDSASNKTEYSQALVQKREPPLYVDFQGLTGDADNNRWQRIYNPDVIPAAPGSTGLYILPQLVNARDIRVVYLDSHPRLSVYSDPVSEYIHPDLAFAVVLERAISWQNKRLRGTDPSLIQALNDAKTELNIAIVKHPIWKPDRRAKLNLVDGHFHDVGEPDKVRLSVYHDHHHHH